MGMLAATVALASLGGVASAQEPPPPPERLVVWLGPTPEAGVQARAERRVGGDALHVGEAALRFAPQPWSREDTRRLGDVAGQVREARDRREEFDVELGLARGLAVAVDQVDVLRDAADRDAMIQALLWQASMVNLAFAPEQFPQAPEARDFRAELPGLIANGALLDALALDPGRRYTSGELPERATFDALEALSGVLGTLLPGTVMLGRLPEGATLVVDGVVVEAPGEALELVPGHHYLHVVVDGQLAARAELDLLPGATVDLPTSVDARQLKAAETAVEQGSLAQVPSQVTSAVDRVAAAWPGIDVYLATQTADGQLEVLPYGGGAKIVQRKAVTLVFGGEIGGLAITSPAFAWANPDGRDVGQEVSTYAGTAGFDVELGVYNVALLGGVDVVITPTEELLYGTGQSGATMADNLSTPVYARVHGGGGLYALRPDPDRRKATLLLAGTYGWFSPGHVGPGAQLTLGAPMGKGRQVRLTAVAFQGSPLEGYPEGAMRFAGLRLGFQGAP